jgi:hypothetical protein
MPSKCACRVGNVPVYNGRLFLLLTLRNFIEGDKTSMTRSLLRTLALGAVILIASALPPEAETAPGTPSAVTQAIEAAGPPASPREVIVGAYINDIQELDFKANNYAIDLYVWFRWKGSEDDPSKTMEFMNRYASDSNIRADLYEKPKPMPDGSFYSIIRYQGLFSTKFRLEEYPFDEQRLLVVMEDTVLTAEDQVYVPDPHGAVMLNPDITLPGFKVGAPEMKIIARPYPTDFGDLSEPNATAYSRVVISVPVTRPVVAMSIKAFVPIGLIVVCAMLVFFVRPRYVEGRIGLGITALLTLVALQLTSTASLPDVDYLMMIDKVFLLAYLFIILSLARVVWTSWRGEDLDAEKAIARGDMHWVVVLLAIYVAANVAVAWPAI